MRNNCCSGCGICKIFRRSVPLGFRKEYPFPGRFTEDQKYNDSCHRYDIFPDMAEYQGNSYREDGSEFLLINKGHCPFWIYCHWVPYHKKYKLTVLSDNQMLY